MAKSLREISRPVMKFNFEILGSCFAEGISMKRAILVSLVLFAPFLSGSNCATSGSSSPNSAVNDFTQAVNQAREQGEQQRKQNFEEDMARAKMEQEAFEALKADTDAFFSCSEDIAITMASVVEIMTQAKSECPDCSVKDLAKGIPLEKMVELNLLFLKEKAAYAQVMGSPLLFSDLIEQLETLHQMNVSYGSFLEGIYPIKLD